MLDRVEGFIREHGLIEPGARSRASSRAVRTRPASGTRSVSSATGSPHCTSRTGCAVPSRTRTRASAARLSARKSSRLSGSTEAELRDLRYSFATDRLRATGHTASDQVESVLLGLVASGSPQRIKARREDGVVRPLLGVWREEVRAWCDERGLPYREDSSNPATKRGLIRDEILPLLERLDPRARASLLSLADERPRLPRTLERTLADLLADREGSRAADLGGGVRAVREYDTLRLEGTVTWGPWTLASDRPGLEVRGRRPGDHLAGRRKKVQDLFVDAKVPRSERDSWPVVVHGEEVVAVPGVAEAPGWEGAVTWRR